jgi:hypothetical protein
MNDFFAQNLRKKTKNFIRFFGEEERKDEIMLHKYLKIK